MRHLRDHRLLVVLPLLLVMLVIVPALTMGLTWVRDVGLLSADAVVFASDAPAMDRFMATAMKGIYGSRIQVCDGAADQVEIQAAVDAGYNTRLSSGSFTCNATTYMPDVSFVTLEGAGPSATTLSLADNSNCAMIAKATPGTTRYRCCIKGLELDGNQANNATGTYGIDATGLEGLLVQDVRLYDTKSHGLYGDGVSSKER